MTTNKTQRGRARPTLSSAASDRVHQLRAALGPSRNEADVKRLAEAVDEWEAHEGEVLAEQGRAAPQGFVLIAGSAVVSVDGVAFARLGPGSAIWSSSAPMPASVVIDQHSWLLMVAPTDQLLLRGSNRG